MKDQLYPMFPPVPRRATRKLVDEWRARACDARLEGNDYGSAIAEAVADELEAQVDERASRYIVALLLILSAVLIAFAVYGAYKWAQWLGL